jgi:hypothetical protein
MEVSGQLHIPAALPQGERAHVTTGEGAGWVAEPVWTLRRNEKFLIPTGNRTTAVQIVARRYTD